jgi:hemoglobin/transferrin/lactoferrin receptor protein
MTLELLAAKSPKLIRPMQITKLFSVAIASLMVGSVRAWPADNPPSASAQSHVQNPVPNPPEEGASTNSVPRLEEVIVTATRHEQRQLDLPFATQRIPGAFLRREQMVASVPEALRGSPGVLVQQTARGQGSPYLRGFTGFRTVALVDGIRLNNSTFRDGPNQYWSTIDALAVDRLEVVKGPGSVMYGSDAVGGAINALMRAPRYSLGEGVHWGGAAYYRFGSAERAHLGRGEFTGAEQERWGFTLGLSAKAFGDVQGGEEVGRQPQTGFNQWDTDVKLEYLFGPRTKLTLAYQCTEQDDVKRTHRTIHGLTWKGLTRGTDRQHRFDQTRQLTYARVAHDTERGDEFSATVSWHVQDESQFVERANRTQQRNAVDVDTLGLSLQGVSPSPIGTWTYGVEHYHDFVGSSQRNFDSNGTLTSVAIQGPVADDASYDLFGLYAQDEIPLAERWSFTLGGRFTWAQAEAGRLRDPVTGSATSFRDDWANVVGSARLLWHPDPEERWSLYTGASQGFRAPNLSDLTRFDIARSGELETAALDLQPEKFLTVEVGAKTVHKHWEAGAAYYHTFIDDLIVRTPTGAVIGGANEVTKRNAAKGWLHGFELSARVYLGEGFTLFGNTAWQEGEADAFPTSAATSVRAPLSRLHPLTGLAGLRWDAFRTGFFAEVFGMAAAKQDRLSPDDRRDTQRIPPGGTPGWATLNFRTGYDWKGKVFVTAALENALNEDYRLHGSGYNQPGRNFKLSLEYRF